VKLSYAEVTVVKDEMRKIEKAPDYGPSTAVDAAATAAAAAAAAEQASAGGSLCRSPREGPRTEARAAAAAESQSSQDSPSNAQIDAVMEEFKGEINVVEEEMRNIDKAPDHGSSTVNDISQPQQQQQPPRITTNCAILAHLLFTLPPTPPPPPQPPLTANPIKILSLPFRFKLKWKNSTENSLTGP
jgi:hypothetical protein